MYFAHICPSHHPSCWSPLSSQSKSLHFLAYSHQVNPWEDNGTLSLSPVPTPTALSCWAFDISFNPETRVTPASVRLGEVSRRQTPLKRHCRGGTTRLWEASSYRAHSWVTPRDAKTSATKPPVTVSEGKPRAVVMRAWSGRTHRFLFLSQ